MHYFKAHPFLKGAVVGMSGGKDSIIVAKLFCEAIGKEKVFGVIMPNKEMPDLTDAIESCKLLEIDYEILNINSVYLNMLQEVANTLNKRGLSPNSVTTQNLPPRIRMATLYAIASGMGRVVANTSNLSETMVGYTTKWGDNVGDISPLAPFTKTEVCEIGLILGLPKHLVEKQPADGLTGKTDEQNLGITYTELDSFIRTGKQGPNFEKIKKLNTINEHKIFGLVKYSNNKPNFFFDKQNNLK